MLGYTERGAGLYGTGAGLYGTGSGDMYMKWVVVGYERNWSWVA